MNSLSSGGRVVLISSGESRDAGGALERARRLDPRDLDDVTRMAAAGDVDRVVFARADDLFTGIWDGQIDISAWPTAVRIELLDMPTVDARKLADEFGCSWTRWNQSRRRRNAIAGAALSVAAIVAAFLLSR